ncbi:carbohydrate sulfotransferase 9-like [Elgaria multicarinata webbii]|uniref:carbohydrate sulfotransferase 9-like n=1 Tax=Elgaria multicarinata webbii TaxID=159646 RepID=UPI002FCCEBBE
MFLLWWSYLLLRPTPQGQGDLIIEDRQVDSSLTFDTLLHIQQVRKKKLRSFCHKNRKIVMLPPTQQEASQVLSSIAVNHKLHFLYCKLPATGVEDWEELLEMLVEEENGTLLMPIPYHQQFGNQKALSEYNLTSMEAMLKSYTKVIFIREPFQRLLSAFMHDLTSRLTFHEFIQYILYSGSRNDSIEWAPLVNLCHPCLVQYDYIMMFGFLGNEVHHLMLRTGLPEHFQIPEFIDCKVQWTYSWLEEKMLSKLTLMEKKELCHFFRSDFAAFHFPGSFLWEHTCIPGSS